MKTSVYIDGFNLYYGALKNTPYKWLDPLALCRSIIPLHDISSLKYFTAKVTSRPDDPDKLNRQNIYLRALQTIPILKTPILVVIEEFQKKVGVINPHTKPSIALKNIAHFYKPIRGSALQASQFPLVLTDGMGSFHKPASW